MTGFTGVLFVRRFPLDGARATLCGSVSGCDVAACPKLAHEEHIEHIETDVQLLFDGMGLEHTCETYEPLCVVDMCLVASQTLAR